MDKLTPHVKLMSLLALAQQEDLLHAKQATDHSERHIQEQEAKRAARAAAARTRIDTNPAR